MGKTVLRDERKGVFSIKMLLCGEIWDLIQKRNDRLLMELKNVMLTVNYLNMEARLDRAINSLKTIFKSHDEHQKLILDRVKELYEVLEPTSKQTNPIRVDHTRSINEVEREKVRQRLQGFNKKESRAWSIICQRFGPNLNQSELVSLAEVVAHHLHLKVDREAKRRKEVVLKWFEENSELVFPFLEKVVLEDEDGNTLGATTTKSKRSEVLSK